MNSRVTADGNTSETRIRTRKVAFFLVIAFGVARIGAIVLYLAGKQRTIL